MAQNNYFVNADQLRAASDRIWKSGEGAADDAHSFYHRVLLDSISYVPKAKFAGFLKDALRRWEQDKKEQQRLKGQNNGDQLQVRHLQR